MGERNRKHLTAPYDYMETRLKLCLDTRREGKDVMLKNRYRQGRRNDFKSGGGTILMRVKMGVRGFTPGKIFANHALQIAGK